MANQKGQIHDIPLKTMDLCLNEYNADIKPYSGFRNNNSPFYGNVLSPFYSKKSSTLGKNSYIHTDGLIYKIKDDGSLYLENDGTELKLINYDGCKFLKKDTYGSSNNSIYPTIIGWIDEGIAEPSMLCVSPEGLIAIINIDGTTKVPLSTPYRYEPGESVSFAVKLSGNKYCFAIGSTLIATAEDHSVYTYSLGSSNKRTTVYNMSCIKGANTFTVCSQVINTSESDIINVIPGETSVTFSPVTDVNIRVKNDTTVIRTLPFTQDKWPLYFNCYGKAIFISSIFNEPADTNTRIYSFGENVSYVDDTTISIDVFDNNYIEVSDLSMDAYEVLSTICDNYSCVNVTGYSNGGYDKKTVIPGEWHYGSKPITVSVTEYVNIPDGMGGFISVSYDIPKIVGYAPYAYKDDDVVKIEHIPGGYRTQMSDGTNQTLYATIPVNANGKFGGGTYAKIGERFRALYHGGELQAVSVAPDNITVGTLLCGMSEIDSSFPICYGTSAEGDYIIYKDNVSWTRVTLTSDTSCIEMKLANDRYLIINSDQYYNCFDVVDKKLYHYATDWNDRSILTCTFDMHTTSGIKTFSDYQYKCENYLYASAQDIGNRTPFTSSQFPRSEGYLPKGATNFKVITLCGYTPNDQDIDMYYGKLNERDVPSYQYSIDSMSNTSEGTLYSSTLLQNSSYVVRSELAMVPSIFATFIAGFINKGIVIDNGHSYLQVFTESTRPVFAISLVSQLEGVSAAFIIQGQYFVIINNSIYSYDQSSGAVVPIVNIGNMQLVGYTPYQAILWSSTNKTFYTFIGNNTLNILIQADEIRGIVSSAYNPNTMSIYVVTNDSIYIFSQEQLLRLNLEGYTKAYPLSYGMALTGNNTLYLSYNKMEGYEPLPIELETELYGLGNNIKSVNDCVYMRFFNRDGNTGKIKLRAQTLNEGTFNTEEKEFNVTSDMWDKESGTLFLRFQPKYQVGTGFSVKIESPFAIASLQISSTPETVQNSKYNV